MERKTVLFSILAIILVSPGISKAQLGTTHLAGYWQLDFRKTIDNLNTDGLESYNSIIDQGRKNNMVKYYLKKRFLLERSGTFEYHNPNEILTGNWHLTSGNTRIVFQDINGKEWDFEIIKLMPDQLKLKVVDDSNTTTLIRYWYMIKQ